MSMKKAGDVIKSSTSNWAYLVKGTRVVEDSTGDKILEIAPLLDGKGVIPKEFNQHGFCRDDGRFTLVVRNYKVKNNG